MAAGFFLSLGLAIALAAAESKAPRVLVLNSYHAGYSWSDGEWHGLQRVLLREFPATIPNVEFLDGKRDTSPEHVELLLEFILRRHKGVHFDLIVTIDDFALQFALAHRDKISADTPIVFTGVNNFRPEMLAGHRGVTGVTEAFDFERSFALLRTLRPGSRTIHLICDSAQGNEDTLTVFLQAAKTYGQGLEFRQIRDWTAEELPERLAALPPGDAAFVMGSARDAKGRVVSEDATFMQEVARRSAVPVFMINQPVLPAAYGYGWERALWIGIGGAMLSSVSHGEAAGDIACRVLRGADAGTVPVVTRAHSRVAFNYPVLVRHGIDPALLPADAEIYNRQYTFYEQHRGPILLTVAVILLLAGAVVVLVVNNLKRYRAEQALRQSNQRLQLLMTAIEQASELIALLNADGSAFYANAALARAMPPAAGAIPDTAVLWRDASGGAQPFAAVARVAGEKGRWQERVSLVQNQGSATILQLIVTPIHPAPDEPLRYLLIAQDITQETRLEEQVRLSQKMEAIGTLASGIAHDFNNILSAILGNAELVLAEMPEKHPSRDLMTDIRTATDRAAHLVRQILAFSRHAEPRREVISATRVLEELVKFLRATIPATITLRHTVKDSPAILADPTQLYQVMLNLCTNAAQAIGPRSGSIEMVEESIDVGPELAVQHPGLRPGRHLRLTVRDDGCGMSPEIVSRIFEPFFTTKAPGQGTGLGLAVVHGIVRNHQGTITVYSAPGKGTSFHLYFPAAEGAGLVEKNALPARRAALPRGRGQQIVFVDDEEALTRMGVRLLDPLGYRLATFQHPQTVLDHLASGAICDLLITDFSMPGLNAFELLERLQKARPGLRVILISGYLSEQDRARASGYGIDRILDKPLTTDDLARAVASVLSDRP